MTFSYFYYHIKITILSSNIGLCQSMICFLPFIYKGKFRDNSKILKDKNTIIRTKKNSFRHVPENALHPPWQNVGKLVKRPCFHILQHRDLNVRSIKYGDDLILSYL